MRVRKITMTTQIQEAGLLAPGRSGLPGCEFHDSHLGTSHHLGPMPQKGVDAVLEGNLHGIAEEIHVLHQVVKDHGAVRAHGCEG